ncbi:MAG: sulfite exporter TauE/SafE family protein [Bacteroidota bacterium]
MEVAGYLGALIMGVVLGLIGGGGSILSVPIFVYLLGINPVTATAYSLFVVGISALVGAIQNMRKGLVAYRTALVFSVPAFVAVYATRKFIVPAIPEKLFSMGDFLLTKEIGIMLFFAMIMLMAAISMIRSKTREVREEGRKFNYGLITLEGLGVGLLTGIVGAGGGFLIIPALVLLAKLPMKKAIATSLMIIAAKSLIGFIGDIENLEIDWVFLSKFTGISVVGIFIGVGLTRFIKAENLKKAFGWFVLVVGVIIVAKEVIQ